MVYAKDTTVSVRETLDEIDRCIRKYGGSGIQCATSDEAIAVLFAGPDRRVRFMARLEDCADEQARKSRARALLLAIKSKFVAVQSGVETFEEAFLAQTLLPDGRTVMDHTSQLVIMAYREGKTPPALLPDYSAGCDA